MKKTLCIFNLFIIVSYFLFAEDYKLEKIIEFKQGKFEEGLYIRKNEEVAPYDDFTAQYINFDKNGSLYFFQNDSARIIKLSNSSIEEKCQIKGFEKWPCDLFYGEDYFIISGMGDGCHKFSFNGKRLFEVHISSFIGKFTEIKSFYYNEETDILFLQDKKEQLYSIINPCLDEEQNKKNFKTPEETSREFENGKTVNGVNVKVVDSKYLYINNNFVYFGQEKVGNYVYTKNREDYFLYNKNTKEYFNIYFSSEDEELESTAIHPSGDIYVLRMNWTTNTHNLYRIENTWDPQWRKEWYEKHETENVSQTVPSTNVAINKEMICNDNLRLRSEEATTTRVITTMQKGTKVKILKLGKAETIDGISSNWVQVEVLADGKDKDGKEIKAGTIGWCYGGYLE